MLRRRLTVVLGILLIVGGVVTCNKLSASRKAPDRNSDAQEARAVRTLLVRNGPVRANIPVTGRARVTDRMLINAEVGGALKRTGKPFREGMTFRTGEVLVSIDDGEVRAQVNAQQSAFLRTLVQLVPDLRYDLPAVATKWNAYLERVPVEGVLPELPGIDDPQERNYLAGRGVLDQYYAIRALYERLAKYVITAPFDGVVVSAMAEPGTIVTPGTRFGEFIAPGRIEFETAITAAELPLVRIGDTLQLGSADAPGVWTGQITRFGEQIDPGTQTVRIFASITGDGLRDGMFLSGQIIPRTEHEAVALPRNALIEERYLYTVRDSMLERTAVELVHLGSEQAIVSGLKDGQLVVTDRLTGAFEGMHVAPMAP